MIKLFGLFLFLFAFPFCASAQNGQELANTTSDSWLGDDKIKHVTLSYVLTVAGTVVIKKETQSPNPEIPAAAGVLLLGIGKEIRDSFQPGNHFCFKDLVWDAAGLLLAVGLLR
ncbi:MAG: DUF2279 domain-containing protein [Bacteroidetes bacterium]|nr:DUF2279 domain-containing protein [Bacteroidota bacterium]